MADRRHGRSHAAIADRPGLVGRAAHWAVAHRGRVAIGWIALLIVAMAASSAAKPHYGNNLSLGGRAIQEANRPSLGAATAIGLLAAIIVLLVTFGSLLAAGLPLITALLGLGTALGLIGIGSKLIDTPDFSTQLAALLGLGVGI